MPAALTGEERAQAEKVLAGLGFSGKALTETLNNVKLSRTLVEIVEQHGLQDGTSKEVGALILMVATKYPASALRHRSFLIDYIKDGRISRNNQCDAALKFFRTVSDQDFERADFEKACGVGVTVSDADIQAAVDEVFDENKQEILEQRYQYNFMKLMPPIKGKGDLAWADVAKLKAAIEDAKARTLGPKTAEDEKPREKVKKPKAPKEKVPAAAKANAVSDDEWKTQDPYRFLPKPEDNHGVHTEVVFSDGHVERYANTREQLKKHITESGGKVITRFPPEPNGYLHIGHAKAMFIDFGMAHKYGGHCYLRFDDTNPEAEKLEFIDHIQEIVAWMGWKPWKITYSSDYFQELYEFALRLIKAGIAYVCHQTGDEIKATREARGYSPYRDRPIEESLKLFEDMRRGLFDEGTATLRLKMDPKNDNRNMDDLIAYRIKFVKHPHAGDGWCIYPSYDYTHCIVDSLENVSHSLCTLEFETRRVSYFWLLKQLDLYMPVVWEYARLNITNNVMSKRKLQKLVNGKYVRGWDDPRMPTLAGMRRRGFTPTGINMLCQEIGISRAENEIPLHKLYHHVRTHLDEISPRALVVLRPLKLVIDNMAKDHVEEVKALDFPGRSQEGYTVPFSRICYIEASDFREKDSKDYYGLAPGKSIMLRYAYPVKYISHKKAEDGTVCELHVEYDKDYAGKGKPPKGVVNWIAQPQPGKDPATAEARLYSEALFKSQSPGGLDEWLEDLDVESEEVLRNVYIPQRLASAQHLDHYQFERLGYFTVDSDSSSSRLVFNRTCTLKDTYNR